MSEPKASSNPFGELIGLALLEMSSGCCHCQLEVAFFRPATRGILTCRASVLHRSKRLAHLEAEVHSGDLLIASAVPANATPVPPPEIGIQAATVVVGETVTTLALGRWPPGRCSKIWRNAKLFPIVLRMAQAAKRCLFWPKPPHPILGHDGVQALIVRLGVNGFQR